jgi:uncharacterized protein (TIGR03083 family)
MEIADYLERIDDEGEQLLVAAEQAGLDSAVPGCPDWKVRDLVLHIGGVHRWAADLIANARPEFATDAAAAVGTGPADGELIAWARAGRGELLTALRAAPADLSCFTLWPADNALAFWARRQAHETAIHRADADSAVGRQAAYPAEFAVDGIEEMLGGFTRRKKAYEATTIRLAADHTSWQITMGEDGISSAPAEGNGDADVTVTGSASDLYCWLWNRPSAVTTTGDAAAAARWEQIRVRWS